MNLLLHEHLYSIIQAEWGGGGGEGRGGERREGEERGGRGEGEERGGGGGRGGETLYLPHQQCR